MNTFICIDGTLSRYDAPIGSSTYVDAIHMYGFEISDADSDDAFSARCRVCRPINNQEVYVTLHGYERSVYALVVWEADTSTTMIFVATPFDLVTVVDQIARYEKSMYDVSHYARLRQAERERVMIYNGEPDLLQRRRPIHVAGSSQRYRD